MENNQNNQTKSKKVALTCLILSTILFAIGVPIAGLGAVFTFSSQIIMGALFGGFIIFIFLVISWLTYKSGYYKKTLYFLIVPFIFDTLVVALLGYLLISGMYLRSLPIITPTPINKATVSSQNVSKTQTNSSDHIFGIMTVSYPENISVGKAIVAKVNGTDYVPQTNTTFTNNSQYVMYFSGISGFTEYHPYNAPAAFVDVKGSVVLYNETGTAIMRDDNVFSSYVGGIPVKDFTAVTLRLTLGKNFKKGNYRWESIVTNNKNGNDYLKGSVNFIVN